MKIHTQSAFIILGTLIIGIILGAVLSTVFVHHRFQEIQGLMGPGQFEHFLIENVIRPVDDQQREALMKIAEKTSQKAMTSMTTFRSDMKTILDSLQTELKPILNDEQFQRLQQHIELGRKMHPMHRGRGKQMKRFGGGE
ncbi:hypothetical protein CEE37_14150 [candidate division LCP-89 bacterium B3_LCP]|uniref:Uncharacterized protein n=1 Tax=candidate division LCP-89 bacterium B3_LCP TaxID=2012998 RepID=A0A532UQP5_UNCL8|nr:MAG: hypothetical protein CEE37_14150 [candidate division LCP-89 bacterium B3_LCP]